MKSGVVTFVPISQNVFNFTFWPNIFKKNVILKGHLKYVKIANLMILFVRKLVYAFGVNRD